MGNYLHVRESQGTQGTPHGVPLGTPHGVPPPDPKAGGSSHCDRVAHGGEICPSQKLEDPLASQQPCRGLLGPEALPLVGRAPGCDLSDPSQVMEPRGPTSHTATAMDPVHGSQSSFGSTDVTLTAQRGAVLMSSYGSESMGKSEVTSMVASLTGRLRASLTAFHPPPPQITKPAGPVIATGLLTVARFVPHGNWRTHLLANSPVGGCWARRPCHSLVGPPGAT